jgi:hypothetical protein
MQSQTIDRINDRMKSNRSGGCPELRYLLLSTSLLVDRVFLYTDLIPTLKKHGEVSVWASSCDGPNEESIWKNTGVEVEGFPYVAAFREMPHNFLRRFNEYIWDYRYEVPSRLSMMRHVRDRNAPALIRALKPPAKLMAMMRTERLIEEKLEKLLLSYPRSAEAEHRLKQTRPDVIVSTGPFQFEQPGVFSAAKKLGIPTLAYIPSWDNVSTKNRMVFRYDGYIVWNESVRDELHTYYPHTKNDPVYVVGAPQFDIFWQKRFYRSREEFCSEQGLDPRRPIVLYAIGSPNFLKEHHGAVHLANRIVAGHLGDVQMLVRPHPIHDNAEMRELFDQFGPNVRLQKTSNAGKALTKRTQDELQTIEWINTFRHADVVVNLSSTVTIDAAIFDKPVVNLDFDPQPSRAHQQLVKEINHEWNHFKPIAESGGVWLVNDFEGMEEAVKTYLKSPSLHSEKRKWIVDHVCGFSDGKCAERMADAIAGFAQRVRAGNRIQT